jgi:isocitrate/isopropylmalate dehydrogenase
MMGQQRVIGGFLVKEHKIALLAGDGVGPELVGAARRVLEEAERSHSCFRLIFTECPFGMEAYKQLGESLPLQTIEVVKEANAALLGAIDVAGLPSPSPVGALRRKLNLYADVRPVRSFEGAWSLQHNINLVCIRENTEGFLADRSLYKGYGEVMPIKDMVISLRIVTRQACENIARFTFDYARKNNRKKVTVLHKANVLKCGCGFFLQVVKELGAGYPEIEITEEYIDSAANNLINEPQSYDVILTTNLFGDIISDEASALVSNMVPTANIGEKNALFIPINHSARYPEAGRGVVNPLSIILCAAMMLAHLGEFSAARTVEDAVADILKGGLVNNNKGRNVSSTLEVTKAVCHKISQGS